VREKERFAGLPVCLGYEHPADTESAFQGELRDHLSSALNLRPIRIHSIQHDENVHVRLAVFLAASVRSEQINTLEPVLVSLG
jgi:hypothetical protein